MSTNETVPVLHYEDILNQVPFVVIGLLGICGNSLLLAAYIRYKELRKLDCVHLLAVLSAVDLMSAFGNLMNAANRLQLVLAFDSNYSKARCIAIAATVLLPFEMNQAVTMAISIDRLRAVRDPLAYRNKNHPRYVKFSLLAAVLVAICFTVMSTVGVDFNTRPIICSWSNCVHMVSTKIYLLANALFGPVIAVIYAAVLYYERQWTMKLNQNVSRTANIISYENHAKMTGIITKLVSFYCILVAVPYTFVYFGIQFQFNPYILQTFVIPFANYGCGFNSCLNFVVYGHSNSNIRPYLLKLIRCEPEHGQLTADESRKQTLT